MIQDSEQLSFSGVVCELRQKPAFTHPKDAEIRALYLSGLSLREVGEKIGVSRTVVEYSCNRQGVMRPAPQSTVEGREDQVLALAREGYGFKAIGKKLGVYVGAVAVKSLLKKHGIKHGNKGMVESSRIKSSERHFNLFHIAPAMEFEEPTLKPKRTREELAKRASEYYYRDHERNKKKAGIRAYNRYWIFEKKDPQSQAVRNVRRILARIMRPVGHRRSMRKENILGCTYDEARAHIIGQLPPHWTAEDYGMKWEIDHIRPLSSFNLLEREQLLQAAHYTNLRPMCKKLNRSMGAKLKRGRSYKKMMIAA